jgi:FlaA1/EpsC-like NDP-sugar epimerase
LLIDTILQDKSVLITGGTGSLGKVLVRRILTGEMGTPKKVIVFSRDEAKQHYMRLDYLNHKYATDETVYNNFRQLLTFRIGDVRDFHSVSRVVNEADIIFNAAALKQVPACEYFPYEAVLTNITGPQNIVRAIREHGMDVEAVIGVSTDKACKPVNVMGMTKAIQERVFVNANLNCENTRFICVRYGNVLASRGSVIPLFHQQILNGGPVTITTEDMTRFLLPLEKAVDTIFEALRNGGPGETYVPKVASARISDVATALIGKRPIKKLITGIRPGEKIHEILVSEEEAFRTEDRGDYLAINPMLPELIGYVKGSSFLDREYSSKDNVMSLDDVHQLLMANHLMLEDVGGEGETFQ